MEVIIRNSGIIDYTKMTLEKNKLNIKYGINGVGKTTIAKSIYYKLEKADKLKELIKYGCTVAPEIDIPIDIKSAIYFDKNYVDNYLFREDILNNSYEIVIKTEKYDKTVESIELKLKQIKEKANCFTDFIGLINDLIKSFPLKKNNDVASGAKAKLINGLQNGDLLKHIDGKIEKYKVYLAAANNFEWSKWFHDGDSFLSLDPIHCPYCCATLPEDFGEIINHIKNTFTSEKIKENFSSKQYLANLSKYSDDSYKDTLKQIANVKTAPNKEQLDAIKILFLSLSQEKDKIVRLKDMSAVELSKMLKDNIIEIFLSSNRLNMMVFDNFSNDEKAIAEEINYMIDSLLSSLSNLKHELGKLQSELVSTIKSTTSNVNSFLKISGIPYVIEIIFQGQNKYQTVLKPIDNDFSIQDPKNKLSYGEQNAVALILFSLEALSKNKDLIILDDPVSSFDDSKKYALIYHLFSTNSHNNFYGKTVLMLTHDFSPIIDFIYNGKPNRGSSNSYYLSLNNGSINEKEILPKNIQMALTIESHAAENINICLISRLIHLRKFYELQDDKGLEYNMLSSLLHLSNQPYIKNDDGTECLFNNNQINEAERNIGIYIKNFSYNHTYQIINNNDYLIESFRKSNNFSKLNITRIFIQKNKVNHNNEVLWKYLCESYHIENNNLFFLDANDFDLIPEYIIKECEKIIES